MKTETGINKKQLTELYVSVIFMIFGAAILMVSNTIPLMVAVEKNAIVNARFYPRLVGFVLIVLSLVQIISLFFYKKNSLINKTVKSSGNEVNYSRNKLLVIFVLSCVVYIIAYFVLGFLVSTILFLFVIFRLLDNRRLIFKGILSIAIAFLIFFLFQIVLNVPLPNGYLL